MPNQGTKILHCVCKHSGQDEIYGRGKRLHNICNSPTKEPGKGARCTVCGQVKPV